MSAAWLWPSLEPDRESASQAEIVTLYPHRSEVPRHLWLDLLTTARRRVWLYANASLFLPEGNPESIDIIRRKAESGVEARILMADPDSPQCITRGIEERLFDAIPARVRMALSYYAPLTGVPGVDFLLQKETLYNSIFAYDDEMMVNQHVYGMYGYMCPILHLRRMEGGDFFDMYIRSFERARESKTQVALFPEDVTPWHGHRCEGGATAPNYAAAMPVLASNIRLYRPLGNRRLVDGATGKAIAWISSRLVLRPTRASYHLMRIEPTGYVSGA